MTDYDLPPVRPAAVHFGAPTHQPLVAAVLITQDPTTGEYLAWVKPSTDYAPPDPQIVAALITSVEIRNLAERDQP
jgi:hypothetical protein